MMQAIANQSARLAQQLQFVMEIDKLKRVLRQTLLTDSSRRENSAEHSWHLALMAVLLEEYAPEPINVLRVIQMVLIHDIVEIDAGDTFCYDTQGHVDKARREQKAADRLFGLLPDAQQAELRSLWDEFETQATVDARFAASLDRIQPILHNYYTEGGTWKIHDICRSQVLKRMAPVQQGAPALWPLVEAIIEDSIAAGYLRDD
ncbi:MAG: HD domain-containing protein [Thainema sp.]